MTWSLYPQQPHPGYNRRVLALWNTLILLFWPVLYLYAPFRGSIAARMGHFDLGEYDAHAPGLKVLVNAVSAGEVVAIASFIHELKAQRPDAQVVLLTTTESGQTMARQKLADAVDLLAYFPLVDLPFVVQRYLDRLSPDIYITTESELWPNIMGTCQRRGIPVVLVNARIYLHNKTGLRGRVVRSLYGLVDRIICQDEQHRDNFLSFGIPSAKLSVSGNTKFDFTVPKWGDEQLDAAKVQYGIAHSIVITAGSTHPGEDEVMLDMLMHVRSDSVTSQAKLVLAPRHIERADDVMALAQARGYTAVKLSAHQAGVAWDVLVVDKYGVLTDMYRLADVVVMGGTFHPRVGGHNILEATALGKPVIVGPHAFSITAMVELLANAGGIIRAGDTGELMQHTMTLLSDDDRRAQVGDAALAATESQRGSAKRAVADVLSMLKA